VCGLRDGIEKFGHFCIDTCLAAALRGELANGLFFRGRDALPFGSAIRSVRELIDFLIKDVEPIGAPA
jgi:nitronate monooxygenase